MRVQSIAPRLPFENVSSGRLPTNIDSNQLTIYEKHVLISTTIRTVDKYVRLLRIFSWHIIVAHYRPITGSGNGIAA